MLVCLPVWLADREGQLPDLPPVPPRFVGNIDVQKNMWGHGIATCALTEIRAQVPDYVWRMSLHDLTAKSFWLLMAEAAARTTSTQTARTGQ
ncbi:hypothetical protein [Nocardia sp. NBC_00403]|uniref:hypothetical protein n=1 Tax=Nocardia sp. NBC_00403 TaxID=2975990 RepID=UPI002E22F3F8